MQSHGVMYNVAVSVCDLSDISGLITLGRLYTNYPCLEQISMISKLFKPLNPSLAEHDRPSLSSVDPDQLASEELIGICTVGLNNSLLNIMSTTQTYKNDIEDQITS